MDSDEVAIREEDYQGGFEPVVAVTTIGYSSETSTVPIKYDVYDAARRGDLKMIKQLVEVDGVDINEMDMHDATPLYYASLCGHMEVIQYLLDKGAHCEEDSFDGERCHYAALSDDIRRLLKQYEAANRQRGAIYAFAYRILDNPNAFPDITLHIPAEDFTIHAHKFILAARSPFFQRRFGPEGVWAKKRQVNLTSDAMTAVALKAVIGYMYTDRLMCPKHALLDVLRMARGLHLNELANFIDASDYSHLDTHYNVAETLGEAYDMSSVPSATAATTRLGLPATTRMGLRECLWNNVLQLAEDGDTTAESEWFLSNGVVYDLQINVQDRIFKGHRAVFATRSPYIAAMLHFESQDKSDCDDHRTITLSDISATVFAYVAEFLYCDVIRPVSNVDELLDLLITCDVLGVTAVLRPNLVAQAIALLAPSNVLDFFHLGDVYNLRRLSMACARLVALNLEDMLRADAFQELVRESAESIRKREEFDSIPVLDDVMSAIKVVFKPSVPANVYDGRSHDAAEKMLIVRDEKLEAVRQFAAMMGFHVIIPQD